MLIRGFTRLQFIIIKDSLYQGHKNRILNFPWMKKRNNIKWALKLNPQRRRKMKQDHNKINIK